VRDTAAAAGWRGTGRRSGLFHLESARCDGPARNEKASRSLGAVTVSEPTRLRRFARALATPIIVIWPGNFAEVITVPV